MSIVPGLLKNSLNVFRGIDFHLHFKDNTGTYPTFLIYQITKGCNSRCSFCSIWREDVINELSLDEMRWLFGQKFFSKLRWINLTGGEPFQRRDYPEAVRIMKECLPELELIATPTNGFKTVPILERAKASLDALNGEVLYNVNVSIDNLGEKHDRSRGIPGAFEKDMRTLQELLELKKSYPRFEVGTETVITSANIDDLWDIRTHLLRYTDHINFTPVVISASDYYREQDKSLGLSPADIVKMGVFFGRLMTEEPHYAYYWSRVMEIKMGDGTTRSYPCLGGWKTAYLDARGELYPCIVAPPEFRMGNVRDVKGGPVDVLWFGDRATEVRKVVKSYAYCNVCTNNCDMLNNMKNEAIDVAAFLGRHPRVLASLVRNLGKGRMAAYL